MPFLTDKDLRSIGFKCYGKNVLISDKASFYNPSKISIGSNVRIDDFCVLSAGYGGIFINDNVHIAVYSSIIGDGVVKVDDFANISSRVSIYSSNDDYTGLSLTNPTVPKKFKNLNIDNVYIGRHVIIGSGSVVLPGVSIKEGSAVGALSLVNKSIDKWVIASGVPAKRIKERKKDLLLLEKKYKNEKK